MKRKWVKWFALISVGIFGMVFFLACGGGGDSDDSDPCSGPVPCLTQDWGGTYYQFNESNGSPVIVTSYGNILLELALMKMGVLLA